MVRIHRAGEGAAFKGLKPAGLGHGVVIPVAEKAIETGEVDELVRLLISALEGEVRGKFARVMKLKAAERGPVAEARETSRRCSVFRSGRTRRTSALPATRSTITDRWGRSSKTRALA